jgi:hypothetical protein
MIARGVAALLSVLAVGVAAGTAHAGSVTFSSTGSEQGFAVPLGVTSIHVVATGGRGGTSFSGPGGFGAVVSADVAVTPGHSLYVEVGGNGADQSSSGGFNGGGAGGPSPGSGGGGASDVRTASASAPDSLLTRLIVAGGGGGGTLFVAGGLAGSSGNLAGGTGGDPGTDSAGGAGGHANGSIGGAGALGQGGSGAGAAGAGGGGGGGGLFGGGGGAGATQNCSSQYSCAYTNAGGGGGGSSGWAASTANAAVTPDTTGVPTVVISYTDPPLPPAPGNVTLSHVVAGSGGILKIPATVSSAGRLDGVAKARTAGATTARTTTYGRRSLEVTNAGSVTLRIKPTKAGRRMLKRHRKLRLVLTVTFTPSDGGTPKSRTAHAVVRA